MDTNNNLKDYPDIISVEDIMKYLSISNVTAYSLLKSGKIKAAKIGKSWKITKDNFREYLSSVGLL